MENENKIYVELRFGPRWTYISTVRTFVENFMAITLENKKKAGNIAMAVNELIENAVKYSDQEGIEIRLNVEKDLSLIRVFVMNHSNEENIKELDSILTEIYKLPPLEAYIKRMQESSKSLDGKNAIGLARIRYESMAELKYTNKNGFVTIVTDIPTKD